MNESVESDSGDDWCIESPIDGIFHVDMKSLEGMDSDELREHFEALAKTAATEDLARFLGRDLPAANSRVDRENMEREVVGRRVRTVLDLRAKRAAFRWALDEP